MLNDTFTRFRLISFIEGISYLILVLLLLFTIIKYFWIALSEFNIIFHLLKKNDFLI